MSVKLARLDEHSNGIGGSFALSYLDGVADGTSLSIQGCLNYELIPNAQLIENLKVSMQGYGPEQDTDAARSIAYALSTRGIGNIMTRGEFLALS